MKKILDWKKYEETARQAIAEGCVLLENKDNSDTRSENIVKAMLDALCN